MKIPKQNIYKHSHRQINIIQNLDFDSMITEKVNAVMDLDKDEQELLDSIENDDWVSIPDSKLEIQRFQDIAKRQISIQKIELQMSLQDSEKIYKLANQLGISMYNFAENIIHKYLEGELVEKS